MRDTKHLVVRLHDQNKNHNEYNLFCESEKITPCIHCTSCCQHVSRLHFPEPLLPQNVETVTHASNTIEIPTYPLTGLVSMRRDYGDVMRLVISTGMRLKQ